MIKKIASIGVVGLFAAFMMVMAAVVSTSTPTSAAEEHKVTICHRSNAANNPYEVINIDLNGANGPQVLAHHSSHKGPVPSSKAEAQILKQQQVKWGDIIPPIDGLPNGLNWNSVGQAIWNNNCNYPKVASAMINVSEATCEVGEILTYGKKDVENAFFRAISYPVSGTEGGPVDYRVVAKANPDALFPVDDGNAENGVVTQHRTQTVFKGTLAGRLSGPQCGDNEEVIASASITITPASCEAAATMTYGDIQHATFSGTASDTAGGDYEVIATANKGAYFVPGEGVSENQSTMTFKGTLDPIVTEGCVLGEETPETPVTPEVLPATGAATPFATIAILAALTGVLTLLGQGVRNVLARKF